MTAREVSDFFRIPLSSVYRLVQNGVLKSIRLGRHVRIFRSEVERLCTLKGDSHLLEETNA